MSPDQRFIQNHCKNNLTPRITSILYYFPQQTCLLPNMVEMYKSMYGSIEKLFSENYDSWKPCISTILSAMLALKIVSETVVSTIYCDSNGALKTIYSGVSSPKTKHIDFRYHISRDRQERGIVNFTDISTDDNLADIMTKALGPGIHQYFDKVCPVTGFFNSLHAQRGREREERVRNRMR